MGRKRKGAVAAAPPPIEVPAEVVALFLTAGSASLYTLARAALVCKTWAAAAAEAARTLRLLEYARSIGDGGMGSSLGRFNQPLDAAVENGTLTVADTGNRRIQCFDVGSLAASWQVGPGSSRPIRLASDGAGSLYVLCENGCLAKYRVAAWHLPETGQQNRMPVLSSDSTLADARGAIGIACAGTRLYLLRRTCERLVTVLDVQGLNFVGAVLDDRPFTFPDARTAASLHGKLDHLLTYFTYFYRDAPASLAAAPR